MADLQQVVDSLRVHELAGLQVERDDFARPELALAHDILGLVIPDTGLEAIVM